MGLLSKDAFVFKNGEPIMAINDIAKKKIAAGEKVINGSIGMLFDENKKLAEFSLVNELLEKYASLPETRKYDSMAGDAKFHEGVKNWLFSDADMGETKISICATMGATGALAMAMKCYGEVNQDILVPSIRWTNYDSLILEAKGCPSEYYLFDNEDKFNLESIKQKVHESIIKSGRVFLLINDPCQNPSGYSLSDEDWDNVLSYLQEVSKNHPVVLVDDIAYINFKGTSYGNIFSKMSKYLNDNFVILIAFSASKSLQIYGLRGGALIALTNNENNAKDFKLATTSFSRTTWSGPNHLATNVMNEIFHNKPQMIEMKERLNDYTLMIKSRADIFIKEADECLLPYYPFYGGFFILVKCPKNNNEEIFEKLMQKGIFIVPMCGGLRISIASLNQNEIHGLAKAIKDCM